ncbi:MAG: hypothetical protein J6J71_04495 [Prevotella sp.]|nr:hypothetical protein [Prevotella sp.]
MQNGENALAVLKIHANGLTIGAAFDIIKEPKPNGENITKEASNIKRRAHRRGGVMQTGRRSQSPRAHEQNTKREEEKNNETQRNN